MNQRQLYHAIEKIASQNYASEEELLKNVVQEVINSDQIRIKGGRIWKLIPRKNAYVLVQQVGQVKPLQENYTIRVSDYPDFVKIGAQKTLLSSERNPYLLRKGIEKYSATGVGQRIKVRGQWLYPYILAFNTDGNYGDIFDTLNV
jgi:hypothetical protein